VKKRLNAYLNKWCDPAHPTAIELIMATYFPTLAGRIAEIKAVDYKALGHLLRSLEAEIVFGLLTPALIARGLWFVPFHDAIVSTESDQPDVARLLAKVCPRGGVRCPFARSVWREDESAKTYRRV
jgi:hypothetical protein